MLEKLVLYHLEVIYKFFNHPYYLMSLHSEYNYTWRVYGDGCHACLAGSESDQTSMKGIYLSKQWILMKILNRN